jgi:hypothetical protein
MNPFFGASLLASCGDYLQTGGGAAADAGPNPMTLARAATPATIAFEAVVLLGVAAVCAVLYRRVPRFPFKFLATAAGVLIFEFFTAPMWRNEKLGSWGYVYHDVSWILTLGWTALIMGTVALVDWLAPRLALGKALVAPTMQVAAATPTGGLARENLVAVPGDRQSSEPATPSTPAQTKLATGRATGGLGEGVRFLLYLLVLVPLVLIAENVVVGLGIRHYSPEVQEVLSGYRIGLVPIEALYYVPVFMALVLAFSRYWGFVIDDAALVPVRRTRWLRALGLTCLAVVLFEVMIEPMVENRNLPQWSYFYRDLSFLLTGTWVILIAIAGLLVQRFLMFRPLPQRFAAALLLITALALPVESWLIHNGYRVYGPSATANFCGITTWLTGVPIEIVVAIPMYMALVVGFIRYWEIVGDNGL